MFFGIVVDKNIIESSPPSLGTDFMITVLTSNFKNFLCYLLLPIFSPILQATDLIGSSFQITMGFRLLGKDEAMSHLFPHALLEFPNMLFYQGVSQYILYVLISSKSLTEVFRQEKRLLVMYLLSLLVLLVAALLEGYVG
uniref:stage II sporulation protein M n=1 Tax=Bacillus multifaciens TaxID=3068506 RepID=UPI003F495FCB